MDDTLALALFFVLRRVRDAADAPVALRARWSRAAEVRAAAASVPEIAGDLLLLGSRCLVLSGERRRRVADACARLGEWALEQGFGELALRVAETGAAVLPGSPRRVYEAARMSRRFGQPVDAEVLYERAITLARPAKDWTTYVRSHLGLGHIHRNRGAVDRTAAHYAAAARRARDRSGERWLAAMIEQDLLALAADGGDWATAVHHAERVHAWMPTHHENVPRFVHDYAYVLIGLGAFQLALGLLSLLVRKSLHSDMVMMLWSAYARAAGGIGDIEQFRTAECHVNELAPRFGRYAAPAFSNVASGAYALGLVADAESYASRSAELARSKSDFPVLVHVEEILGRIARGEPFDAPPLCELPSRTHALARNLAVAIEAWRGPTWKRKIQAGGGGTHQF